MCALRRTLMLTGLLAIGGADGLAAEAVFGPPPPRTPPDASTRVKYRIVFQPKVSDFYPAPSIVLGEQGKVIIKMCWNADGKVVESTLVETSGNLRLDEAAIRFGMAYVFTPGTENGVPLAECAKQAVNFRLAQSPPR